MTRIDTKQETIDRIQTKLDEVMKGVELTDENIERVLRDILFEEYQEWMSKDDMTRVEVYIDEEMSTVTAMFSFPSHIHMNFKVPDEEDT